MKNGLAVMALLAIIAILALLRATVLLKQFFAGGSGETKPRRGYGKD